MSVYIRFYVKIVNNNDDNRRLVNKLWHESSNGVYVEENKGDILQPINVREYKEFIIPERSEFGTPLKTDLMHFGSWYLIESHVDFDSAEGKAITDSFLSSSVIDKGV